MVLTHIQKKGNIFFAVNAGPKDKLRLGLARTHSNFPNPRKTTKISSHKFPRTDCHKNLVFRRHVLKTPCTGIRFFLLLVVNCPHKKSLVGRVTIHKGTCFFTFKAGPTDKSRPGLARRHSNFPKPGKTTKISSRKFPRTDCHKKQFCAQMP